MKEDIIDKEEKLERLKKKHERIIKKQEKEKVEDKRDDMIKDLSQNVKELQDKLLYHQAEFANYKRRREEETSNLLKYENYNIGLELLPIIDSFERALNSNNNPEISKYLEGFKMIYHNLTNILDKYEIKEIDCLHKEFDHNYCQALMTEHRDGVEPGIVIEVLQKGYLLKDKLLRASLVKVSE